MVERFHRRLKVALRARCAVANWVLLGLLAAAREDDGSTPAQEVFGSPLILPGQFLDSSELPPKTFLEPFSKTLSAAEHSATRHNTAANPPAAAAASQRPRPRTDDVREAGRAGTTAPAPVRRPLHRHSPLPALLHGAHRRQGGQGVYPPTQALHRSYSAAHASQGPGWPARGCPLPGFSAARGRGGPLGAFCTTATSNQPGTIFPWHAARGFCTPCRRSQHCRRSARPQPPSAVQIRPLGLRPRGLGGAL
jgi:hypothetical protein